MRINLLPESYRPQPQVHLLNLFILLAGCLVIIVVSYFAVDSFIKYRNLQKESGDLTIVIDSLQSKLAEVKEKEALIAEVEKFRKEVADVRSLYQEQATIYRTIANVIPGDIWMFSAVINTNGSIKITGASLLFPQISEFLSNLKRTNIFTKIHLNDVSQYTEGKLPYYRFSLDLETGRNSLGYNQK